ncbi:MAG TPA: ABC transporter permease [Pseudolabrys sp.]|nr:ABC transporter permease [Pseudolabrys sp.]
MTATTANTTSEAPRSRRLGERREALARRLLVVAFGILIFAAWEIGCRVYHVSDLLLPPPSRIVGALIAGFHNGLFTTALKATLLEVLLGFAVAAAAAFACGMFISQLRIVEVVLYPYIVALQTLPKIAIAPFILIWIGFGIESKIVIAAMVAFFPMLVNNIVGLKSAPPEKIELMRSLSASRTKIFWYIQLPEALPYVFAGLNIGIVMSVLGAIVGEFIGAKAGLGYLLLQMNYNMDVTGMFAVLVILGLMGIILNAAMQFIRRKIVFWLPEQSIAQ